ncbi:PulJ/GspJ family protein [Desulfopila aestuarii]|uniref:Prepilin-type N-terminal cleavage/methylation domain-containing protein n=1 Tax=Desulfopila aestuarii DSM 18488 TaxID=1121416 RepID=A0A1M7YE68_9BACT|nr:type II secretion system protein [Desulfopila aestuarii]SHO50891.1 prepilin-type N-terminal cleavage/methylation domain-containing protein [Desulfopila aestuarii DSM 18488]
MSVMAKGEQPRGFTLLEVLISISVFALVVSSVYGAYRVTFQTVSGSEGQATAGAAARVILERISEDLTVIATDSDGSLQGKRGDVGEHRADGFSCVAFAHLPFSRTEKRGGRAALTYSTEENESGRIDLYRLDSPVRPGEVQEDTGRGEILGKNLLSFHVSYVGADGSESEEWTSGSEEDEGGSAGETKNIMLPVLIRVEILVPTSQDDETGIYFRTAVALPVRGDEPSEG